MLNKKIISLFTLEQWQAYATVGLDYAEEIADNTFVYNAITRTVRMRKASDGVSKGFRIPLYGVYKDDLVVIRAEYQRVSGKNAGFLAYNAGTFGILIPSVGLGEWENIVFTCLMPSDFVDYSATRYMEVGGYKKFDSGECQLRNVTIEIKSQYNPDIITAP